MKNIKDTDEQLKFLEERNNDFLERVKSYGFDSIQEYINFQEELFYHQVNRNRKYPVGCDC